MKNLYINFQILYKKFNFEIKVIGQLYCTKQISTLSKNLKCLVFQENDIRIWALFYFIWLAIKGRTEILVISEVDEPTDSTDNTRRKKTFVMICRKQKSCIDFKVRNKGVEIKEVVLNNVKKGGFFLLFQLLASFMTILESYQTM